MKSKFVLGSMTFTSKAKIKKHAAQIKDQYAPPGIVNDVDDIAFLNDLIARHIHAEQKIGCGIKEFFVNTAPNGMSTCFWIRRNDGTTTDFGVPACLENVGRINLRSLREAVKYSTQIFRNQNITGDTFVSAYSGKVFPSEEAVVDHVIPFNEIVKRFFAGECWDIKTDMLTESVDGSQGIVWRDPDMIERFVEFHDTFPRRIVHWRENLSELRKGGE